MMRFAFAWQRKDREKQLNAAWKIYESGRFHSDLSSSLFQSASKRFARIYMSRENERLWYKPQIHGIRTDHLPIYQSAQTSRRESIDQSTAHPKVYSQRRRLALCARSAKPGCAWSKRIWPLFARPARDCRRPMTWFRNSSRWSVNERDIDWMHG